MCKVQEGNGLEEDVTHKALAKVQESKRKNEEIVDINITEKIEHYLLRQEIKQL